MEFLPEDVVENRIVLAPELEDVANPAVGDQTTHRALALDHRIAEDGGAMHHFGDRRGFNAGLAARALDALAMLSVGLAARLSTLRMRMRPSAAHSYDVREGPAVSTPKTNPASFTR